MVNTYLPTESEYNFTVLKIKTQMKKNIANFKKKKFPLFGPSLHENFNIKIEYV